MADRHSRAPAPRPQDLAAAEALVKAAAERDGGTSPSPAPSANPYCATHPIATPAGSVTRLMRDPESVAQLVWDYAFGLREAEYTTFVNSFRTAKSRDANAAKAAALSGLDVWTTHASQEDFIS